MVGSTALIVLAGDMPSGFAGFGAYIWFNIFLFSFLAIIGLGISYLMLRLERKWRTTVVVWSLVLFFPIYFGVFYELVARKSLLFSEYGLWISSGWFGASLFGIQLAATSAAWLIGYDWLRSRRPKASESTG